MSDRKIITGEELRSLLKNESHSDSYISWKKINPADLKSFEFVGVLKSETSNITEYETSENYWSSEYPIALDYFPNQGSEVYFYEGDYYLVYRDFGGHAPERRCRLVRKELIVPAQ